MVQQHQVVAPTYSDPPLQLVEARFQVVSVKQGAMGGLGAGGTQFAGGT